MTQIQSHQTLYDLVDPKQGYNNVKLKKNKKKLAFEQWPWKKLIITLLSNQETCQLSPLNMCESQK